MSQVGRLEKVQMDEGVNKPKIGLNFTLADDKLNVIREFLIRSLERFVKNGVEFIF